MANAVSTIYDNVLALIAANVDSSFSELGFVHEIEKNDSRRLDKGYGLRFLDGPLTDTLTKAYTIDQGFEIILTRTNPRTLDDSDLISAEKLLYDAFNDDILPVLINKKAGSPGVVLLVSSPSFSEPELLNESKYVALRVQIIIRYRQNLT